MYASENGKINAFYELRRQRASLLLKGLYQKDGLTERALEILTIEENMIEFFEPEMISGKRGYEAKHVEGFEKSCFYLKDHISGSPKESTLREFFTAFYEQKKRVENDIRNHKKSGATAKR